MWGRARYWQSVSSQGDRRLNADNGDVKASLELSAPAGSTWNPCARVMTSPRFVSALLGTVLLSEFGVLFLRAGRKLFWYDELFTFFVSKIHPFSLLLRALWAGVDGMPPGYHAMIQLASMLPGDPLVTFRLPSILGYILTLLGIYWFVCKRFPTVAGLAAVLLVTLSPFRGYALEARSYALLVGSLAISAALWQRIGERRLLTPLFALFLAVAVSCHYLAVFAITLFGIAELAWTFLSRRIRWGVWVACLLATCPFFLGIPILLHFQEVVGRNFWAKPDWGMVVSTYSGYLWLDSTFTLVLIFFFVLVVGDSLPRMWQPGERMSEYEFTAPEIFLISGFLFYPILLVLLANLLGSGYTPRYGWPGILGLVLGSVHLVRPIWFRSVSAYLLAGLLIVFAVQSGNDLLMLSKAGSAGVDARWTKLAISSRNKPSIPVVIGNPMAYLEAMAYAPPELRDRLVMVVDPGIAARLLWSDTPDQANCLLAQFVPLRVEYLAPFQVANQKFLLYSGGDWLTQYLIESKYHLTLLSKEDWAGGGGSLYVVER